MIFKVIEKIRPYFFSLREIDGTVSLDMRFPLKWKFDYQDEKIKVLAQDKNDKSNLISFVAEATNEGYELVISVAESIIKFNVEVEEKDKLFQQKINELKDIFASESLDTLRDINFVDNKEQPDENPPDDDPPPETIKLSETEIEPDAEETNRPKSSTGA